MRRTKSTRSHNCTFLTLNSIKNLLFVGNEPQLLIISNEKELVEVFLIILVRPFFSPILIRSNCKSTL